MSKLISAPAGYVWAWHGQRGLAHLTAESGQFRLGRCGRYLRQPRKLAFQVGGYSAQPCPDCLKLMKAAARAALPPAPETEAVL